MAVGTHSWHGSWHSSWHPLLLGMGVDLHSVKSCRGLKKSRLTALPFIIFIISQQQHNFSLTTNSSHYFQTTTNQHRPTMGIYANQHRPTMGIYATYYTTDYHYHSPRLHPPRLFIWRPIYRP